MNSKTDDIRIVEYMDKHDVSKSVAMKELGIVSKYSINKYKPEIVPKINELSPNALHKIITYTKRKQNSVAITRKLKALDKIKLFGKIKTKKTKKGGYKKTNK